MPRPLAAVGAIPARALPTRARLASILSNTATLLSVTLLGCALLGPAQSWADSVRLRADAWYPYNGQPGADKPGYMVELAERAWAKADLALDYQLMPWERAIDAARSGEIDCIVGATPDEVPDFLFSEQMLGTDETHAFTLIDQEWEFTGVPAFAHVRLGVVGGYAYDDDVVDRYIREQENTNLVQVMKGNQALEKNLRKLMSGRIDAVLASPAVMASTLKQLGFQNAVRDAGAIGTVTPLYIACSPQALQAERYLRLLDEYVTHARDSGELDAILRRYDLNDWQTAD